ncbi:MAG: GTP cyclohydrolase MptA [Desulfurococcales archaeon]|nr:GTP cyclohydrolase MptA [Desulfurococcales archaeon]
MKPDTPIKLDRVGFEGLARRVTIRGPEGPIALDLDISVYIDLGPERRGAHLSRNVEAVVDALNDVEESWSIEAYLDAIARRLLEKHAYATQATVKARTTYHVDVEYAGIRGKEPVGVEVRVHRLRGGGKTWVVSVSVRGMTVCPSSQAAIASIKGIDARLAPGHSQRVLLRGSVASKGKMVRIEDLASTLFSCFSAPTFTLLKRMEEARLVMEAFANPKFLEDVVREAAFKVAERFGGLIGYDALVEVEAWSQESIHPHNLYSYKRGTIRDILLEYGEMK